MNELMSLEAWESAVNAVLDGIEWDTAIDGPYYLLCYIVVIFQAGKIAAENLLRGGEAFVWSKLKTPFFTMMMIVAWPTLHGFVQDASGAIREKAYVNSEQVIDHNNNLLEELRKSLDVIDEKIDNVDDEEDSNWFFGDKLDFSEITSYMSTLDDRMVLAIYASMFRFATYLDSGLYAIFFAIAAIWLKIIAFGAPIAFVVSLLTGGYSVLINWAKTYLAVSLWLPTAAMILALVNRIFLSVITKYGKPALTLGGLGDNVGLSVNPAIMLQTAVQALLANIILIIIFLAIKIIILAKVPQMIQGFISGGQSAAGGFGAAFIPVSVAKSAAGAGVMAASGGTSAAVGAASGSVLKK